MRFSKICPYQVRELSVYLLQGTPSSLLRSVDLKPFDS